MSAADLVYLDNAATTPLDAEVLAAMLPWLRDEFANPSALHAPGVRARAAIDAARERVLRAVSSRPGRVVFTSGGTEANNLAIAGLARLRRGDRLVTSAVEHPSAARAVEGAAADLGATTATVGLTAAGVLDLERLADALTERTLLVALIHVQNESGVIQPIAQAAAIVRQRAPRAYLHIDAIQSFGKLPLHAVAAVADSIALSAHKLHGPKGTGALVLFSHANPRPRLVGGSQELGVRAGTENVAGIVGFGHAAAAITATAGELPRMERLAARVRGALHALGDVEIVAEAAAERSPFVTAAVVRGIRGEVLQHQLERAGVIIGTGSACHSGQRQLSASLAAHGLDLERARAMVRVSLSHRTVDADIDRLVAALTIAVPRLRELVA